MGDNSYIRGFLAVVIGYWSEIKTACTKLFQKANDKAAVVVAVRKGSTTSHQTHATVESQNITEISVEAVATTKTSGPTSPMSPIPDHKEKTGLTKRIVVSKPVSPVTEEEPKD